ncbi:hypothetical protein E2P81_ATG00977 [Venturia nashicola]|nr:hypothetical protein E2P81_ATG00977 [Venturia nashicola]
MGLVVSLARKQAAPVPFHCRVSRESSARARLHFWQHESGHSPINNTTDTSTIVADHFISVAVLPSIQIISHHLCDTRQARKPEDSSSPREVFTTCSSTHNRELERNLIARTFRQFPTSTLQIVIIISYDSRLRFDMGLG